MGISHDYHSTGRSRRGGPGGVIRFAGAVAGILLVSFAITAILEHGQAQPEELPTVTANGTAQNILAPLPMQGAADSTTDSAVSGGENAAADGTPAVTLEQFGPARQTAGAYSVKAYDSSVIRQPASGQVDLSYFSDAAVPALPLSVVLSAAPCMGSGARMFCAVPLAVTVGSSSGCACPCSRMAVMAKLTSRMPATAPANRMTPPGPPLRLRPVL